MYNQNKIVTVSVRINENTLDKIKSIYKDWVIGSGGSFFNNNCNKSFVIEKAIDVLYLLDLSDKDTFFNVFGHLINDYKKTWFLLSEKKVIDVIINLENVNNHIS